MDINNAHGRPAMDPPASPIIEHPVGPSPFDSHPSLDDLPGSSASFSSGGASFSASHTYSSLGPFAQPFEPITLDHISDREVSDYGRPLAGTKVEFGGSRFARLNPYDGIDANYGQSSAKRTRILEFSPAPPPPPPPPPPPQMTSHALAAAGYPMLETWQAIAADEAAGLVEAAPSSVGAGTSSHEDIAYFASSVQVKSPPRARNGLPRRGRAALRCVEPGCQKLHPTHGNHGDYSGTYCAQHGKERGMQNIVTPRCRHRDPETGQPCALWPAFGRETDKSPTFCAQHALAGMKNINNPKCRNDGCERWPSFGTPGTKTPIYCAAHKMQGMVDVVKPRCRHELGCGHRPSFGWPDDKVPSFCRVHKPEGMVDVANPRCTGPDCTRRPSFGIDGQRATRCAAHKLQGMVDVVKPRCREPGCSRIAYYKLPGTKGATRCSQHREQGMVRKG